MEFNQEQSKGPLGSLVGGALPVQGDLPIAVSRNAAEASSQAVVASLDLDRFFEYQLLPVVKLCRSFRLDSSASPVPESLRTFLEDPQNRAQTWLAISQGRFNGVRTLEQKQALVAGLLPYVAEDFPGNFFALSALVASTARSSDKAIYRELGNAVQPLPLGANQLAELAGPYVAATTHNLTHEPHLAPWAKLFTEKGDLELYEKFIREIAHRVMKGELSSYDHLLSVVCASRVEGAQELLGDALMPPAPALVMHGQQWTFGHALASQIGETIRFLPLAMIFGAVTTGPQALLTASPYLVSLGAGAISTFLKWLASGSEVALTLERPEEFGIPFFHLAEKVYSKLERIADTSPEAARVLSRIEGAPSFGEHIPNWKKKDAHSANG